MDARERLNLFAMYGGREPVTISSRYGRMSPLPPKADMCGATRDVRFGPKADMTALRTRSRDELGR
jgi:hypothetical protein